MWRSDSRVLPDIALGQYAEPSRPARLVFSVLAWIVRAPRFFAVLDFVIGRRRFGKWWHARVRHVCYWRGAKQITNTAERTELNFR